MDNEILSKLGAWASILGILIPALIYTGKQLLTLKKRRLEMHKEFEEFIELIVKSSTTATARSDAANYLNIENRRWHSLAIRTHLSLIITIIIILPFMIIGALFVKHWLGYVMVALSLFSVIGQTAVCLSVANKAQSHSRKILDSWSTYIEKNINRSEKP